MADAEPRPPVAGRTVESRLRVRYAETDQMGVVYYANYLVWFEVGRTEWLRAHGWTYRAMEAEGLRLPVIEARCAYRQPAKYDDEILVRTTARQVSPVRLAFDYDVRRADDQGVVATGVTLHTTLDGRGRPVRLPARVKEFIA
jgi:acyl-CoA thioester hydrolase